MKTLRIVAGGIAATAVAGAGLFLGAGPAGAVPDVVDRPYSDAKALIAARWRDACCSDPNRRRPR